jgi:hypothetical protein
MKTIAAARHPVAADAAPDQGFPKLVPARLLNGCPVSCLLHQALRVAMDRPELATNLGHALETAAEELGSDREALEAAYAFVPGARRIRGLQAIVDALSPAAYLADRLGNGDLSKFYQLR